MGFIVIADANVSMRSKGKTKTKMDVTNYNNVLLNINGLGGILSDTLTVITFFIELHVRGLNLLELTIYQFF